MRLKFARHGCEIVDRSYLCLNIAMMGSYAAVFQSSATPPSKISSTSRDQQKNNIESLQFAHEALIKFDEFWDESVFLAEYHNGSTSSIALR
jgi:hypothetical protein